LASPPGPAVNGGMTQTPLEAPPHPSVLREIREIALTLIFAIILALAIRIVLF